MNGILFRIPTVIGFRLNTKSISVGVDDGGRGALGRRAQTCYAHVMFIWYNNIILVENVCVAALNTKHVPIWRLTNIPDESLMGYLQFRSVAGRSVLMKYLYRVYEFSNHHVVSIVSWTNNARSLFFVIYEDDDALSTYQHLSLPRMCAVATRLTIRTYKVQALRWTCFVTRILERTRESRISRPSVDISIDVSHHNL